MKKTSIKKADQTVKKWYVDGGNENGFIFKN